MGLLMSLNSDPLKLTSLHLLPDSLCIFLTFSSCFFHFFKPVSPLFSFLCTLPLCFLCRWIDSPVHTTCSYYAPIFHPDHLCESLRGGGSDRGTTTSVRMGKGGSAGEGRVGPTVFTVWQLHRTFTPQGKREMSHTSTHKAKSQDQKTMTR